MGDGAAIRVEGLEKRFGDVHALAGVDFEVAAGTVFGLLGPNGAGKTTAVRILTTILPPDGGRASVLGRDVVADADAVRSTIGLAGQYAAVDEVLTGRENLRMIGALTHLRRGAVRPRADELLAAFDLVDAADRPVKTYSGGMRRRLDLAAALLHRPPVLFLDEPTTGLDLPSRNALWAVIEELVAAGTTVLLTTQYLEEVDRLAHQLAVVDQGRVIAEGTPAALKAELGATSLHLSFADAASAGRAATVLAGIAPEDPHVDGSHVRLTVADGTHLLRAALRALDAEGIEPDTINLRHPTLDDVFLALTGHTVAVDAEEAAT